MLNMLTDKCTVRDGVFAISLYWVIQPDTIAVVSTALDDDFTKWQIFDCKLMDFKLFGHSLKFKMYVGRIFFVKEDLTKKNYIDGNKMIW